MMATEPIMIRLCWSRVLTLLVRAERITVTSLDRRLTSSPTRRSVKKRSDRACMWL